MSVISDGVLVQGFLKRRLSDIRGGEEEEEDRYLFDSAPPQRKTRNLQITLCLLLLAR